MSNQGIPSDAPPSYTQATGKASATHRPADSSHLNVPGASSSSRHGIPMDRRRSMEDEHRPLPKGWVRSFDPQTEHQFFVDTTQDPPRSTWTHPYDDEQYLSTLSTDQRETIEQESLGRGRPPSKADIIADHTDNSDDEDDNHHSGHASSTSATNAELPPRPNDKGKKTSFGRKLKDKVTGMTHEEREQERQRRAAEEQRLYEQHQRTRAAMAKAAQTGQPQLLGKDKDGKDVYIEPPSYGGGMGYGGGYGYNPYQSGSYSTPNARYIRPQQPYGRPYGGGFGGGYGLPLALGGGLMGGLLLGDMMGGGMGGGMGFGGGF
ncbi:hypothetical protein LTR62_002515 [Meristemomyces frigidus]|uniref:WW domain-containing protein n=1 Tax=Meristemomyces frigidus TaxID=1508187 RepID=A0AAN7TKQ0_9PEZI|nr:hypothetical protein LTR62_002515 [Meristemomyces frigidus]